MRALSFWQPHGSLIVTGAKPFETRGRATNVRGTILIHASARMVMWEMVQCWGREDYRQGLSPLFGFPLDFNSAFPIMSTAHMVDRLAFGAFVGMGDIIGCYKTEEMTAQQRKRARGFGDFSRGRFAWEFANVKRFRTPIPAKGKQGFWFASVDLSNNELISVS